jgi:hypothetical protein
MLVLILLVHVHFKLDRNIFVLVLFAHLYKIYLSKVYINIEFIILFSKQIKILEYEKTLLHLINGVVTLLHYHFNIQHT